MVKSMGTTISDLLAFREKFGFIHEINFETKHGIIVMHDPEMMELAKKAESPLETDTVESFVEEKNFLSGREANLTVTSAYDKLLERWVPIFMAVLFGKGWRDYKKYWD